MPGFIYNAKNFYSSGFGQPEKKVVQPPVKDMCPTCPKMYVEPGTQSVLVADIYGNGLIAQEKDVQNILKRQVTEYTNAVGDNIRGGVFGSMGFMIKGAKGSFYGAGVDGVVMSFGGANRNIRFSGVEPPAIFEGENFIVSTKISLKQARHIEATRKDGGGYFSNVNDAQEVLDAINSGKANLLGVTKAGHFVFRYDGVTGTNVNVKKGIVGEPTNVFILKGSSFPSVVPTNPNFIP